MKLILSLFLLVGCGTKRQIFQGVGISMTRTHIPEGVEIKRYKKIKTVFCNKLFDVKSRYVIDYLLGNFQRKTGADFLTDFTVFQVDKSLIETCYILEGIPLKLVEADSLNQQNGLKPTSSN